MALTTERQQALEQLKKAERPLIVFRKRWTPDGAASAAALYGVLKDMGKKPEMVCEGFAPVDGLKFLPHLGEVRPELSSLRTFVISVDTTATRVGELSYEAKDGELRIFLKPKSGVFEPKHVRTGTTGYQHDLIVALDAQDLRALGDMTGHAADFFLHTPIVNIDHSPANEQFGQVNLVDPTATSCGEVVFHLCKEAGRPISPELATAMLSGMIAKTRSFKSGTITPRALAAASELVALGAKREEIVSSLYRTKTIPTLKLWGRALARMKYDPTFRVVSTVLTRQDFAMAGADEEALRDVSDDLIATAPEAETIALLYERADGSICCVIRDDARKSADRLTAPWNGEGGRVESRCFLKGVTIAAAEKDVLEHLRKELAAKTA